MSRFRHRLTTLDDLRALVPPPDAPALRKEIDHLDDHCRTFLARSPFLVIATNDAGGRCDASPRGGDPGFVQVLDRQAERWPREDLPSIARAFVDHIALPGVTEAAAERALARDYELGLWPAVGEPADQVVDE